MQAIYHSILGKELGGTGGDRMGTCGFFGEGHGRRRREKPQKFRAAFN